MRARDASPKKLRPIQNSLDSDHGIYRELQQVVIVTKTAREENLMRLFGLAALGLLLTACAANPRDVVTALSANDPKYESDRCRDIRERVAKEYSEHLPERIAIGSASGALLGPAGLPVAAVADLAEYRERRDFDAEIDRWCVTYVPPVLPTPAPNAKEVGLFLHSDPEGAKATVAFKREGSVLTPSCATPCVLYLPRKVDFSIAIDRGNEYAPTHRNTQIPKWFEDKTSGWVLMPDSVTFEFVPKADHAISAEEFVLLFPAPAGTPTDDEASRFIVGTWTASPDEPDAVPLTVRQLERGTLLTFNSDGTGKELVYLGLTCKTVAQSSQFSWSVQGGLFILEFERGEQEKQQIVRLTATSVVVREVTPGPDQGLLLHRVRSSTCLSSG
jgi:hypothetical protein